MIPIIVGALVALIILGAIAIGGLIHQCPPNQLLVFSGRAHTRVGDRRYGYRIVRSTLGVQVPFLERVDAIDLTNMIIELTVQGAYAKGGVAVNVYGVANVKIASHEPLIHHAIERFMGKTRPEVMQIAKVTLEGALRGVLATLTPEQLNESQELFREQVVTEADQDMTALGLVVDTLRIQSITDDSKYFSSIGRIRNAELLSSARVAEAIARADASVRSSENNEREVEARIQADISITAADGERMIQDAVTRRAAVVAEEQAKVAALVAKANADLAVQKARVEQVRKQLQADVIAPASAKCEAMEQQAKASVATIIEEGRARAEALTKLAESWRAAGPRAREIFLIQQIEPIIRQVSGTISQTSIEKYTVLSTGTAQASGGFDPTRLAMLNAQVKEVFGIDLAEKLKEFGSSKPAVPVHAPASTLPLSDPVPPVVRRSE